MAKNTPPQNMPPIGRPGGGGGPMGSRMKAEKPKNTKKTLVRLLRYIGRSKLLIILLIMIMVVATVAELAGPALQGLAIDTILEGADGTLSVDFPAMLFFLSLMGVLFAISSVLHLFQGRIAAKLSQNTVYMLRNDLFKKISKLPIRYTDTHKHGDIMSRMTNDVENVSNAISQSIASLISSALTLVGAFAMMIYYNPAIALIACLTIPMTITLTTKLAKFMRKYYVRQQKILGKLNGQIEEMVTSYKTVVAYGKEDGMQAVP